MTSSSEGGSTVSFEGALVETSKNRIFLLSNILFL
jgi:hypothetical protein